ncbi:MAG TPA: SDR family oxidoreductase [Pseudogracilibacillus sp.]|nr:SDR family oxidoreductase [Pseudogracilibacillus sp.]
MRNILVIGASGDIGKAIVKQMAEADDHASFILHYNQNKGAIHECVQSLRDDAVLQVIQADLTTQEGAASLIEQIHFPVHAVIFVSGMAYHGLFQEMEEDVMDKMMHLHVKAPWLITQHVLGHMIKEQAGKIIFITSIWGSTGASNEVIYSAVKGAQNSFVKALGKELAPNGIRVNAVSPGFIETKMNDTIEDEDKKQIMTDIPAQRAGLPEEVAHAVQFLLDDRSNYIVGEIIQVSGGWHS